MRLRAGLIAFVVVLALTLVVLLIVLPDDEQGVLELVGLSVPFGLIAAAIVHLVAMLRLLGAVKRAADPDRASQREIWRAVIRNDDSMLDDAQRDRAPRFAAAFAPFQTANAWLQGLIISGVLLLQGAALAGGQDDLGVVRIIILVVIMLGALAVVPSTARQISRARRYAREHPIDATAGFEPAK